MRYSTLAVSALALLFPAVQAHTYMSEPEPMGGDYDSAPLDPSGANYPCKLIADGDSVKTYTPGVDDYYKITGSAVHGGGSCQISVTYDENPTPESVFKVVQSYEGSCPVSLPGNYPSDPTRSLPQIPVKFPVGLKSGKAVFAWTWFNKVGNREMYMNCARITIGGSSKSDEVFNSLPDMFVANLDIPASQCTTTEGVDIQFPNPGNNVIVGNSGVNLGPACSSYKNPPKVVKPAPPVSSAASRPVFVGNPDMPEPTRPVSTMIIVPKPTSVPDSNDDNNDMETPVDSEPKDSDKGSNNGSGNMNNGGSMNNGNNNTGNKNVWGAKPCTNKDTMLCNADRVTFNWCDENGSLWENEACPLRTVCVPGKDIRIVHPVADPKFKQASRRHIAAHRRRSHHH